MSRIVQKVVKTDSRKQSEDFFSYHLSTKHLPNHFDPILNIDHFYMSIPFFKPHPHAGFSPVTLMFEDSGNSFINRDSLGDRSIIAPGDLHWTTAGSGLVHEEVPEIKGKQCHGFQIFVNLPAKHKLIQPTAQHLDAKDVPIFSTEEGVRARVLVGQSNGVKSPCISIHLTMILILSVELVMPITLLDVQIPKGKKFSHQVTKDDNAFAYILKGSGLFGPSENLTEASTEHGIGFGPGDLIEALGNSEERLHFVLFTGKPLNEPIVIHGPFVMNSQSQIRQAMLDYQMGKMGDLEASF